MELDLYVAKEVACIWLGVRGIDDRPSVSKLMLKVTCRNYYLRTHLGDNKYLLPWDA